MFRFPRRSAGQPPRAYLIALSLLLAGVAVGAARAETLQAEVAVQSTPAFTSSRLSVEVMGTGPDVILIPGFASSREVWRPTAERLAATHRVHLVQLAGFAGEPWSHGDGPLLQPALDELARYVRESGLERPAVIGHSMGGLSALMLAQQNPDLIGRVMSVDSLPFFSALYGPAATPETARPFADQAAQMMLTSSPEQFRAGQSQGAVGLSRTPETQAAMVEWSVASDRQALAIAIREVMTTDVRPQLATMSTPVWAVYAADAEGGAPPAVAEAMWSREYADLPGVRLIRVDGSRHFIMADQPERFAEIVDAFLAE
ncbi:MAG: alpha/beta hydrolase [Caulobacterales bacterium]|nr:alpha/beta hydrolase [Caulobacterales bacterium]